MVRRAFRLAMHSPLHISSESGVGEESTLEYIPSDTLFGALIVTWLSLPHLRTDTLAWLSGLSAAPAQTPLRITSAFPCVGHTLLLPLPLLPGAPEASPDQAADGKRFKKVRWVASRLFAEMIDGMSRTTLTRRWAVARLVQGGSVWLDSAGCRTVRNTLEADEEGRYWLWQKTVAPHVAVDRVQNASTLYHVGRVHFGTGCGLWFMAEGSHAWLDRIEAALDVLSDSGIGGQRSRGHGQFSWQSIEPPLLSTTPSDYSDYVVLLSRTAPREDEMTLLKKTYSSYSLVMVGGYSSELPYIRRRVRLLREGSLIGNAGELGQFVDVKPSGEGNPDIQTAHAMWRYGCGFGIPVRVGT